MNIFSNICQPSPTLFLDKLVLKLLDTMIHGETPKEAAVSMDQHISTFDDLHDKVWSLENELMTLVGCGKELESLNQCLHQMTHIVVCLEELYCVCYEGLEAFQHLQTKHNFLYQ